MGYVIRRGEEAKNIALSIVSHGGSFEEAAEATGYSADYVRQVCTKAGIHIPKFKVGDTQRHDEVVFLAKEGLTAKEIASISGYKNSGYINQVLKKYGVAISAKQARNEKMRSFKAEGHTNKEVAEKFGVGLSTADSICKGIKAKRKIVPERKRAKQCDEIISRAVNERLQNIKYAGNYTGSDGTVDLECEVCGHVFTRSWSATRHGRVGCPECAKAQSIANQKSKEHDRKIAKADQTIKKQQSKRGREVVRLLKRAERLHACPVCGEITDNQKYCSEQCRRKAYNQRKEFSRRNKVAKAMIDADISLEKVYEIANGVCNICGGKCDWNDYRYKDGFFIVGDTYPSVDHIVPLAKGGVHSWNNVQLAHHICNSRKGASLIG